MDFLALLFICCVLPVFVAPRALSNRETQSDVDDVVRIVDEKYLTGKRLKISQRLQDAVYVTGHTVKLECASSSQPRARIQWKHNGAVIQDNFPLTFEDKLENYGSNMSDSVITQSFLTIPCPTREDSGTYTCIATSSIGKVESSAQIVFEGHKRTHCRAEPAPTITDFTYLRFENDHNSALLSCAADQDVNWTWKSGNEKLKNSWKHSILNNGNLLIRNITYGYDNGEYSCTATNMYGQDTQYTELYIAKVSQ